MSARISNRATEKISRKEQKAATRDVIKKAARRCFAELGYDATGIADIAKAAGVAHGTFYVHFAGKDEVLDEMLAEFNAEFVRRLQGTFKSVASASIERVVEATAEKFLDYWQENKAFVESYAQRSAVGMNLLTLRDGVNPPMAELLRGALAAATAGRSARKVNVDLVTHALLAMWLRVGLQFLFNDNVSRREAVDTLVQMSVGAVEAMTRHDS